MSARSKTLAAASTRHSNADLFLWALALVGGREGYVDIEDVYWKCFELAPSRFGWRTRSDVPDLQKISVARRDVIKRQSAAGVELVTAQEADVHAGKPVPAYRWRLTTRGVEWVDDNSERLVRLYGGGAVPAPSRRPDEARVRSVRGSVTFRRWMSDRKLNAELWELADLLECSPASTQEVWNLRLDSLHLIAKQSNDTEMMDFVGALRDRLREISR
jgi:hypothetical protein